VIVVRTAFIAPQGIVERPGEQFVIDLIWLCVLPEDRIEHIRVLAGPLGFDVVWFILGGSEQVAWALAKSISRRVIAATPLLANWWVA
jgi:hypothetical protein